MELHAHRRDDFTYGADHGVWSFHGTTVPTVGHQHLAAAT